jgi:hypothetical protein
MTTQNAVVAAPNDRIRAIQARKDGVKERVPSEVAPVVSLAVA